MKKLFCYFFIFATLVYSVPALSALPALLYAAARQSLPWVLGSVGKYMFRPAANDASVALEVGLQTTSIMRVPVGWTSGTEVSPKPVPPASSAGEFTFQVSSGGANHTVTYATKQQAFLELLAIYQAGDGNVVNGDIAYQDCGNFYYRRVYDGRILTDCTNNLANNLVELCPTGYTSNGTACDLTNANVVQKPSDMVCEIFFNGSGWALHSVDPDCDNIGATTTIIGGTRIEDVPNTTTAIATYIDVYGNLVIESITPYQEGLQLYDRNNFSQANGALSIDSVLSRIVTAGSQIPTSGITGLPTDYNREDTQKSLLAELKLIGESISASSVAARSTYPEINLSAISSVVFLLNDIPNTLEETENSIPWWSWQPAFTQQSCSSIDGNVHGFGMSLDLCFGVNLIRSFLGWVFAILAAWSAFHVVFRK